MREQAGVFTGYALGPPDAGPARSFAADVLSVFVWCTTIAARLAKRIPEAYSDITPAAVASQLRAVGVAAKNVREPGQAPVSGCERTADETLASVSDLRLRQASR